VQPIQKTPGDGQCRRAGLGHYPQGPGLSPCSRSWDLLGPLARRRIGIARTPRSAIRRGCRRGRRHRYRPGAIFPKVRTWRRATLGVYGVPRRCRNSLMRGSAVMRSWRSSARVRVRRGIINPRPCPGSALSLPIAASPVGVAKIGNNRAPPTPKSGRVAMPVVCVGKRALNGWFAVLRCAPGDWAQTSRE
jgi:hypothetical protein